MDCFVARAPRNDDISKRRIAAVNHKTIRSMIRRRLAHQVHRDAAEIGRIAEASEIAEVAVWLCTPAASFVLGVALPVDGGYVVP